MNKDHNWRTDSEQHIFGDATPRTRRRLEQRDSANLSPSPLQQSERLSQGLRRVSLRVVNFAGAGLDDHIRLPDGGDRVDATGDAHHRPSVDDDDDDDRSVQPFADLGRKIFPLHGRTLCSFGPTSRVRQAMYDVLIFLCVFRVYLRSCAHLSDGYPRPQMDRTSHSLFHYSICRSANHTILLHPHIVLNFWLINLFVAVITNTFSAIRTETRSSAFSAAPLVVTLCFITECFLSLP